MNLPCRFAGCIIASFTGMAMRQLGGRQSTLIRYQSHSTLAPDPRCRSRAANQIVGVDHPLGDA